MKNNWNEPNVSILDNATPAEVRVLSDFEKRAIEIIARLLERIEDECPEVGPGYSYSHFVSEAKKMLGKVPNVTDENIQELREIILDAGSSRNYQNKKIREWLVRYFK